MHATPNNPKPGKKFPSLKETVVGKSDPTPPPGSIQASKAKKKPTATGAAKTPAKKAPSIPMVVKVAMAATVAVFLLIVIAGVSAASVFVYTRLSPANIPTVQKVRNTKPEPQENPEFGKLVTDKATLSYRIEDNDLLETTLIITLESDIDRDNLQLFLTFPDGWKDRLSIYPGNVPGKYNIDREIVHPGMYFLVLEEKSGSTVLTQKIMVTANHSFRKVR